MFQQINKIGDTLISSEEVSYLLNGINADNKKINMVKITINTDRIFMALEFETAVVHLSNCLIKVRSTCEIPSVDIKLEVRVKNQERCIVNLR